MLKSLKTKKATSKQDFPIWVSKNGCDQICEPITYIFNTMLSTRKYPNFWKCADILPIPKVPSPSVLKIFRPISLFFHLGKLAEQIIISKMNAILTTSISNDQYGSKPGISTTDAILHLLGDFTADLDSKICDFVQAVCLDFSKAFDCLQPDVLVEKMKALQFNHDIIFLIRNFLTNRKLKVTLNGFCSNFNDVLMGVPQGTKLGPILWLIYINDLSFSKCNGIKYADDTTIYQPISALNFSSLKESLHSVEQWAIANGMLLNAEKTAVMNVCLKSGPSTNFCSLVLNDICLNTTPSIKFLGVTVDQHLTFTDHVNSIIKKSVTADFIS